MHERTQHGREAEHFVAEELQKKGFKILEYNYIKKFGEIDLIASHGNLIVFVEVKMRHDVHFDLTELITPSKQRKIITVAKEYIARYNHTDKAYQFDVALVQSIDGTYTLSYIPDAFREGW